VTDRHWAADDLEHVPTLPELARRGLAHAVPPGTHYRATPEGQALIYAAMKRNADRLRDDPDLARKILAESVALARSRS